MATRRTPRPVGLTTRILVEIRDAARQTNERLEETRDEVRKTNERLHETNDRLASLERRQTDTEIRLSTEIVAVAEAVGDVRDLLREGLRLAPRLADHETRIAALERKVG